MKTKIYCYVDESGQDPKSEVFVVVAIVTDKEQDGIRKQLLNIESKAKLGKRKWHKSKSERKFKYLRLVLENKIAKGEVFFGKYKKPLPYFMPMLNTIEKAIKSKITKPYQATIYIDGIDKKKALELTNALRISGITTDMIKSRRDESEPLIRLADMWAGCIRAASLGQKDEKDIFYNAQKISYLKNITN